MAGQILTPHKTEGSFKSFILEVKTCYQCGDLHARNQIAGKLNIGGATAMTVSRKRFALALALLMSITPVISLHAAQQDQKPTQGPIAVEKASEEKSYNGKIQKVGEKFVLKGANGSYELDDQEKAHSFEGKDVKVTGTLDAATHTIYVKSIEPAA